MRHKKHIIVLRREEFLTAGPVRKLTIDVLKARITGATPQRGKIKECWNPFAKIRNSNIYFRN